MASCEEEKGAAPCRQPGAELATSPAVPLLPAPRGLWRRGEIVGLWVGGEQGGLAAALVADAVACVALVRRSAPCWAECNCSWTLNSGCAALPVALLRVWQGAAGQLSGPLQLMGKCLLSSPRPDFSKVTKLLTSYSLFGFF